MFFELLLSLSVTCIPIDSHVFLLIPMDSFQLWSQNLAALLVSTYQNICLPTPFWDASAFKGCHYNDAKCETWSQKSQRSSPLVFCVPLDSSGQTDRFSLPEKQTSQFVRKLKKNSEEHSTYKATTTLTSLSYGFFAITVLLCVRLRATIVLADKDVST